MHAIDQLTRFLKFNNRENNMHNYVDDLKNYYVSAKASGWKFPMGTALLIHLLKTNNPTAENNQALWDIYIAMNLAAKTAIELHAKNHDIAVLALHYSCMPQAIH